MQGDPRVARRIAALLVVALAACTDAPPAKDATAPAVDTGIAPADVRDTVNADDTSAPPTDTTRTLPDTFAPSDLVDAATQELPGVDAAGVPCGNACSKVESCWENICVRECSLSLPVATLAEDLAPGISIVAHFCSETETTQAFATLGSWQLVELKASDLADTTGFTLGRWPLYATNGPEVEALLTSQFVPGSLAAWQILPGDFLSVNDEETHVVWGYMQTGEGYPSAIHWTPLGDPDSAKVFNAMALAGAVTVDGTWVLASALGAINAIDGPGLYLIHAQDQTAQRVVAGLGEAVGAVARIGDYVVAAGYSEAWPACEPPPEGEEPPPTTAGQKVLALPWTAVMAAKDAGSPVNAQCQGQTLALPPGFKSLPGGLVLTLGTPTSPNEGLSVQTITSDGESGLQLTTARTLTTGARFIDANRVGTSDFFVLRYADGYLLVNAAEFLTPDEPAPGPPPDAGAPDAASPDASD